MANVPDANRLIARHAAGLLAGDKRVTRYWDEPRESHVDLLACTDDARGVTTFATVSLSDHYDLHRSSIF